MSQKTQVGMNIKYSSDTEKKIDELFPKSRSEATNPSIELVNGELSVKKEVPGSKIDLVDLENKIENQLNGNLPGKIQLKKVDTRSNFTNADIDVFKNDINNFIDKQLYLQSDYKKIQVKKEDLLGFIDLERTILNQKLTLSEKNIDDYLENKVSRSFNIKGKTKQISSVDNSVIREGTEGKKLDISKSAKNIIDSLSNNESSATLEITTDPIEEEVISPGYNPGKYPGKYIEVNISDQMLYRFEGTQLLGSYQVSTGKWSMPTPEGEYSINNKDPRAYSQEYDLYMPFWMSFIGSQYGIHELPEWANGTKEGEGHLGTPVSHGCIRLGRGAAQEVYDWAEIGTPVFIHR